MQKHCVLSSNICGTHVNREGLNIVRKRKTKYWNINVED